MFYHVLKCLAARLRLWCPCQCPCPAARGQRQWGDRDMWSQHLHFVLFGELLFSWNLQDGTYTVTYSVPDWAQGPLKLEAQEPVLKDFSSFCGYEGSPRWPSDSWVTVDAQNHRLLGWIGWVGLYELLPFCSEVSSLSKSMQRPRRECLISFCQALAQLCTDDFQNLHSVYLFFCWFQMPVGEGQRQRAHPKGSGWHIHRPAPAGHSSLGKGCVCTWKDFVCKTDRKNS